MPRPDRRYSQPVCAVSSPRRRTAWSRRPRAAPGRGRRRARRRRSACRARRRPSRCILGEGNHRQLQLALGGGSRPLALVSRARPCAPRGRRRPAPWRAPRPSSADRPSGPPRRRSPCRHRRRASEPLQLERLLGGFPCGTPAPLSLVSPQPDRRSPYPAALSPRARTTASLSSALEWRAPGDPELTFGLWGGHRSRVRSRAGSRGRAATRRYCAVSPRATLVHRRARLRRGAKRRGRRAAQGSSGRELRAMWYPRRFVRRSRRDEPRWRVLQGPRAVSIRGSGAVRRAMTAGRRAAHCRPANAWSTYPTPRSSPAIAISRDTTIQRRSASGAI
jgi:hypothetical protein